MWVVLAFLTAIAWGLGRVILKPAYEYFSEAQVYLFNGLAFSAAWVIYTLVTKTPVVIPFDLFGLLPILPPVAFLFFTVAMKKAKVSTISAVGGTLPLVVTLLAVIFLKEKISFFQFFLILVIGSGLTALGLLERKKSTKLEWQGFLWGLAATLGFSISNIVSKMVIDRIGPASFSLIDGAYMLMISFVWLLVNGELDLKSWEGLKMAKARVAVLGDMLYGLGGLFMFLALQVGLVSLVIPITNTSILISTFFAAVYLKEKISKNELSLIVLIFISTTLLALSG